MKHGTYIGPLTHLKGKGALLNPDLLKNPENVAAQFDDRKARRSEFAWPQVWCAEPHNAHAGWWEDSEEPPVDALGYGWHAFPKADFQIDEEPKQ